RNTVLDYIGGGKATEVYHNIEYIREVYPHQSFYSLMNLLSSHDVPRTLHLLGYKDNETDTAKIKEAKQRFLLGVFIQMTFPGSPAVYYGDEVGVTGGEDPYNRATYPWVDNGGKPDEQMRADFKALINLRKQHPVLRHGSFSAPLYIDEHVIVLARNLGNTWAITATNNSTDAKKVNVKLPSAVKAETLTIISTGERLQAQNNSLTLSIPSLSGIVLVNN
ncbi:MAG: alpha-amylase family glycosyl hydrolase, partial [Burkholderiales bacterium]